MSNFACEHCGANICDSPRGYVTGCEHYQKDCSYNRPPVKLVRSVQVTYKNIGKLKSRQFPMCEIDEVK